MDGIAYRECALNELESLTKQLLDEIYSARSSYVQLTGFPIAIRIARIIKVGEEYSTLYGHSPIGMYIKKQTDADLLRRGLCPHCTTGNPNPIIDGDKKICQSCAEKLLKKCKERS